MVPTHMIPTTHGTNHETWYNHIILGMCLTLSVCTTLVVSHIGLVPHWACPTLDVSHIGHVSHWVCLTLCVPHWLCPTLDMSQIGCVPHCVCVPHWLCPTLDMSHIGCIPHCVCPTLVVSHIGHVPHWFVSHIVCVPHWLCPTFGISHIGCVPHLGMCSILSVCPTLGWCTNRQPVLHNYIVTISYQYLRDDHDQQSYHIHCLTTFVDIIFIDIKDCNKPICIFMMYDL